MHHVCGCRAEVFNLGVDLLVPLEVNLHEGHFGRPTCLLVLDKILVCLFSITVTRRRRLLGSCRSIFSRCCGFLHWSDRLFLLDVGVRVHLSLLKLEVVQSLSLHIFKDLIVGLLEHGFDLVQALLHRLQVLHHHAKEIGLGILVKRGGVKRILLDNLMKEEEGLIVRVESLIADASLESFISELIKLFLEGRSPGDAILLLLLNMLNVHVRGIIKKGHVPLHHILAELTGILTSITVDIKVDEALGAVCLPCFLVEEFLKQATPITDGICLFCGRHRGEFGVARLRIHVSHLFYSVI